MTFERQQGKEVNTMSYVTPELKLVGAAHTVVLGPLEVKDERKKDADNISWVEEPETAW
jgi:hypothetical protein